MTEKPKYWWQTDHVHTKEFFKQDVLVNEFTSQLFINHTITEPGMGEKIQRMSIHQI